jgi:hypothetical protein
MGLMFSPYTGEPTFPRAVDFDGSTYLSSTSGVTGVTQSTNQYGIFSFWVKRHQIVTEDVICASGALGAAGALRLTINGSGLVSLDLRFASSPGSNLIYVDSTATILDTNWHHVLVSYGANDGAAGAIFAGQGGVIAIDDVIGTSISKFGAGFTLNDFTAFGVGGFGAAESDMCLAEFWYADTQPSFINITNSTTRRLFIKADGTAEDLGFNGETPLGATPPIYMSGDKANWIANLGDGGGFTENGTLKVCTSRPR